MENASRKDNSQLIGGLVLIGIGALFLLDKFWDTWRLLGRFWPLAMVITGVWLLVQRGRRAGMGPLFLILLGGFFQAQRLDWIDWRMRDFWPVLLIAMGLWMLVERGRNRGRMVTGAEPTKP